MRDPHERLSFECFFEHPFVSIDILSEDYDLAMARKLVNQASLEEQNGVGF